MTTSVHREVRLRKRMAASATLTVLGVLTSLQVSETLGAWLTAGAMLTLVWTIHEIGRLGPETPQAPRESD